MQYSDLKSATLVLALLQPTIATAACMVCDELIEITEARAVCLLDNFDAIAAAVDAAPKKRKPIDLDSCSVDGEVLTERGGLATLPTLDGNTLGNAGSTKSVYTLDGAGLECLKDLMSKQPRPFDPVATFDLFVSCQK